MRKKDRHQMITQVLNDHDIKKQEDFVALLNQKGVEVTQATISRDIKEMKLVKVPAQNGGYRYSMPRKADENINEKLSDLLKEAIIQVDQMEKFVHLKTYPGNASAVANLLERQFSNELFAILDDDDSVLMIMRTEAYANKIQQDITIRIQRN